MSAPAESVAAVREALGCLPLQWNTGDQATAWCGKHGIYHGQWTDRGCPVAVAAADAAVQVLGLAEERCCDRYQADREEGDYKVWTCSDMGDQCRTRLVTPWSDRIKADDE